MMKKMKRMKRMNKMMIQKSKVKISKKRANNLDLKNLKIQPNLKQKLNQNRKLTLYRNLQRISELDLTPQNES